MRNNPQTKVIVRRQLDDALAGVANYLENWSMTPQAFTTQEELKTFAGKLREMRDSLDKEETVQILGLWRIMETWPYKNELRQKIVEAELSYERLKRHENCERRRALD